MGIESGPGLKMYSLLNMGIFQPAMLVYWKVVRNNCLYGGVGVAILH